jgi:hypothetical protein
VLINDWIGAETKGSASNLSSIYLASFTADEGLHMAVPSATRELPVGDPRKGSAMGFRLIELGEQSDRAVKRTRVKFAGVLGLRSVLALARASGISPTA